MNHISAITGSAKLEKLRYLALFVVIVLIVVVFYWQWNSIMSAVVEVQRDFHTRLAAHIRAVGEDTATYGWALIALSFAYGVFHAVGPGHGKAVIATYLGTHQESLKKGIGISMATALMQAIVAITLVTVLAKLLSFRFADIDGYGEEMALVSYVLVILLGLVLSASALRRIMQMSRSSSPSVEVEHAHHHHDHAHHHNHHQDHHHGTDSCCQHAYVPDANQSWLHTLGVVVSIGIRPCSGAIVVLIYAHLVGVFHYGILATLLMGLGTGITVSAIAIASQYARSWLERVLASSASNHELINMAMISISIRLAGGVLLILMGWGLYSTALQIGGGNPLL